MKTKGKTNFGFFENFEIASPSEDKIQEEENIQEGTETAEDVNDTPEEIEEEKVEEQEESIEEEVTDPPVDTPEGKTTEEEKFSFQPLIEDLEENGILRGIEGKEYTDDEDGFRERFRDSIEAEKNAWIESIPEEHRHLIDYIKAGKDVKEYFKTIETVDYSSIDIENEDVQKNLITEHLTSLGYKDAYIKKKLETYEGLNELGEEAKIAQEFLVAKQVKEQEELRKQVAEEAKAREIEAQENLKNIEKIIYDTKEIAGFKLSKKDQKAFRDYLLEPDKKTGLTPIQMNDTPERRLKLAYLDFIDFKKDDIEKKAKTEVSRGLQKVVSRYTSKSAQPTSGATVREPQESHKVPDIFGIGRQQIIVED